MASLRAQQAQLLQNTSFLDQIAGSLLFAASQVVNEAAGTPNHANRIVYANAIFLNPQQQARTIVPGVLTNATIAAAAGTPDSITDNDVDFVVASLFDAYANQHAATLASIAPAPLGLAK
jgi:hypothetical protein